MAHFELVVIGSGPGGYVAAIKAAQLGLKTALIEKDSALGGTCLNVGCIPSKALLHSTEIYHFLHQQGDNHGIKAAELSVDIPALMKRKDQVVKKMNGGVKALMEGNGVEVIHGRGTLDGPGKIQVDGPDGQTAVEADHIILATGSAPVELPNLSFDGENIVSSDQAIAFEEVPEKLIVIGAGAIGLELGSVWSRLGSEVTILEFLPKIAPTFDDDISKLALRIFKKQGLTFELSTKVTGAKVLDDGRVVLKAEQKGEEKTFEAHRVLVCVGRQPYTEQLGLDSVGIETDDKGRIPINHDFETKADGIFAIGDVTVGPMLAHKAEEEGVACAEIIAGQKGHVNYNVVPNVIYTEPEIASVGITEATAKEEDRSIKTGKFSLQANGRAVAMDAADGVIKVIADAESDELLGIQIVAKGASELIAAAVTHMEYGGSAEDLGRTIHAHPTISEALKEAGLSVNSQALHAVNK